ncbi:hypothetical protein C5167_011618 [Papaver somniferum]|uniref:RWD domain-containing protein n=1 Tax=Papaver somniferum TaxID=3469 RepID=A0A4Y7K6U0_PAPSO|nr:hypothetical protein C5167_011618 [Papaver somniferum]
MHEQVHDRIEDGLCCCGRDGSKQLVMDGYELKQMVGSNDVGVDAVAVKALRCELMLIDLKIDASDSGLNTSNRCFQITISPQEEDDEETSKVLLALVFAHTEKYPDEPPLLHVKSLKGISLEHLQALKQKLEEEVLKCSRCEVFALRSVVAAIIGHRNELIVI